MARIRTIKPEFWGDEKLAPMTPLDRLVFLALISIADDAGRLVDNVKTIDGFVFPSTDDSSRESLDTLASSGRIIRYSSESGQRLIQVAHWQRHQKVDRPSKYVLPRPSSESRESLDESSRSDLGPTTSDLGPPTSEQRQQHPPRDVLGVDGPPLTEARDELVKRLGDGAQNCVDDFLTAAPSATRFAWARGLVAMLDPLGGRAVSTDALLLAMQDFLVADRDKWPFVGRVFRAFVDDAKRPKAERAAAPAPHRVEHWKDKQAREEVEEGERQMARSRAGNVDVRRGQADGFAWYTRMQREAKALGRNVTLYAYDRMHEAAEAVTHA